MQILTKRFGVLIGFAVMLALVVANGLVLRRQLASQIENQRSVVHTRQVMLELAETESILKDAETGQRGFLYTGDPNYLGPYQSATGQIAGHLDALRQLTADNPRQQVRVAALRELVQKKLAELGETISLAQAGDQDGAKAIVRSDAGLFLMDDIRRTIAEMRSEEDSLDVARSATYRQSIRTTILCIYLASSIAALGLILLAYYILHEMELRKRHAYQLLEREEWFRVTLTSLGDAVIATDKAGRVNYLNPLAEQLIGTSTREASGRLIEEVFPIFNEETHAPVANPVGKVLEEGRVVGLANHTVLRNSSGALIPIEDSAAPIRDAKDNIIGVVLVFRDATLERRWQESLRESEKLRSAARMSATVAHEINNPLEAVVNLIYLAKTAPEIPAGAVEHLELAEQELERVSHITRQTLGFYRESKVPERIDVEALVEYVLKLYSGKLSSKNIAIERDFGPCQPVRGLQGELKQAISNLVSNAADAVEANGKIRLTLACVERADGEFVQVLIEDNGPGVAPEHVDRIFEPFFTTKKDVGTGLGLWVTKEIIDRHRGSIEVHPQNGNGNGLGGAAFDVLLPCEVAEEEPVARA
jgi:PAS domain S-box-containing protein